MCAVVFRSCGLINLEYGERWCLFDLRFHNSIIIKLSVLLASSLLMLSSSSSSS